MAQDRIAIEGIGKRRTSSYGIYVTILLSIIAFAALYITNLYNSLLFYTIIELFSVVVSCAIFIIAWNSRSFLNNNYLLLVGVAYLFVAGLDGLHTLTYTSTGLFPGYGSNLSIQLWIAARYVQSLSFLIAPLLLHRKLNISVMIVTYTIVFTLMLVSVFSRGIFPTCFIEGAGPTLFKTVSEYVIVLIFIGALILLDRNRQQFDKGTPMLLAASIGITIASELTLALNANDYALPNFIGYLLKAISFYLIYRAFIETGLTRPYVLLFSNLKQSEENVVKQSQELVQANTKLEREIAERKQVAEQLRTYQEHLEDLVTQRTAELSTSNMELQLEVAERKQAEETLDRVNRALKTLSECNQAMARATEESELLEDICRALVKVGGYRLAWVGFAKTDEAKTVRPVARSGYEDGYLDTTDITWADTERGHGPVGTAIRTGQTCITRNIADDANFAAWRAEAVKRGYASVIALPVSTNGQTIGSLNIYAPEPDAFGAEEVKQLTELADDLSFGITALRTSVEQERAEEELRLKAQMLDAATDSIMLYDSTDGSFVYVNEATCKSRGFTRDELMRMKRQDLTAPEARQLSRGRRLKEILEKGHLFFETIHRRKDGTTIPVEANVHVIETGGRKLILSVTRDITERKQAEETLRESEKKYRQLVDGLQEGIWVIDKDACTTFVNPRMAEMLGYTIEEMQGKHLFYFMDEQGVEFAKQLLEHRRQGITEQHDFEFLRKDGARLYTSIETSPITDEIGNYMGAFACVADITERRKAELEYKTIVQTTIDGFWLVDMQGRFLDVNNAYCQLIGYSRDELLKMSIPDIEAIEKPEETAARVAKIRKVGRDRFETRHRCKDGSLVDVEVSVNYIDIGGGGMFVFIRDISDRKRAEKALRESEEKYATLIEKSNDGIIIIQDGILKFTNSRMIEMTGFTPDEALGKPFIEFIPPEHAGMLIDRYTRRKAGEKVPDSYETEILTRDGRELPVEVNVCQIEYKGRLVEMTIIRDITERKKAQEELKRSEERYRFLAENALDVIYKVSFVPTPHFEYISPSVIAQFGYTAEECYADPEMWSKIIHPAYRMTMSEFGKSPALPSRPVITRWMRKDGTAIWTENSSTLLYDENGKVIAMQGISRDVTERVQAELLYRTLASNSPVGVYIIQDGKFVFNNPKIQKDTGYTEEDLLDIDPTVIIHPKDRENARKNTTEMLKGKRLQPYEYRYVTKTGETRWALENVVSIDYGGRRAVLGTPMDITERKQAEELYTTLASSSPISIYILQDRKFVFTNPKFQKDTGYTEEELLDITPALTVHPEDRERYRQNSIEMLRGQRLQPYEYRYVTKTGKIGWVLERVNSITYNGRPAILGTPMDITERKQAEEALHQSEERYQALFDRSLDIVYVHDFDGKFIDANQAALSLLGYDKKEITLMNFASLITQDQIPMALRTLKEVKETGVQQGLTEFRLRRKNGEYIIVETKASLIYHEGKPYAIQGIARDITERKQAEELYTTLANSSPTAVYIFQDNKFIFTNPNFQKTSGYSANELLGKDPSIIIHPEDRERVRKNAIDMLKGKRLQPYEYRFVTKTGETRWALENVVPINYGGRQAVLGTPMDITERKQAEELYTTLASSSPVGIYIAVDDHFIFANAMMQRNTDYTEEELLGKETLSIIHPEDKGKARENAIEMLKGKRTQPYEFRYLTKTGETRWALGRMTSVTYQGRQAILGVSINITEYKQAELLYHNLADGSPIGVYIHQGDRFIYTNPAFKKATGYTDDYLTGKDSPWLVHPEDRESVRLNAIEMLKGKRLQPYEFRYVTKNGETRWALERVSSITYEGKRATLGNFMDVTERKQAEQLYHNLAENSSVGVYIVQDRKFVFTNPAFHEATGYASDDLLGRDPSMIIHPEDRESVRLNAVQMLKGQRLQPYEFRFITKSGETRWALERASSINYDGGQATLGNFLDMTELKQAMSALQESEEKLRLMFQAVTDGIVITDMNGSILDVNERVLKMFGLQSRDDVIGKSAFEFIASRHRDLARKNFLGMREQGAEKEKEYALLKADGSEFPGETSGSLLKDASGEPVGFITVIRDVTERRRMEEQLVLTDRLASIGELAAGIAHELNNPLTGVIGLSQLLLEKTIPADIQDDLKIICSEAQRASHVVKNLLMFARKHSIVKAPVDVTEVLDKVLILRAYEQKVNNIEVIRNFASDLPKVPADYFQLQQVFLNIIINAEYFMTEAHHRGKLIISAERINDFVRISFADDGPGIIKENLAHLFDPFFTTKEVGKGTGLGLSICHGIVISHGGKIYTQSEFGKGATFTIELPLTERQEEREAIE